MAILKFHKKSKKSSVAGSEHRVDVPQGVPHVVNHLLDVSVLGLDLINQLLLFCTVFHLQILRGCVDRVSQGQIILCDVEIIRMLYFSIQFPSKTKSPMM